MQGGDARHARRDELHEIALAGFFAVQFLAFEGDGDIEQYIGGYSDYLEAKAQEDAGKQPKKDSVPKIKQQETESEEKQPLKKLTYKLEHELQQLPQKIQKTEDEIAACNALLADADFYARDAEGFHAAVKQLEDLKIKLERYESRWLEIEEMKASA